MSLDAVSNPDPSDSEHVILSPDAVSNPDPSDPEPVLLSPDAVSSHDPSDSEPATVSPGAVSNPDSLDSNPACFSILANVVSAEKSKPLKHHATPKKQTTAKCCIRQKGNCC